MRLDKNKKIVIVAGELSGDIHGALLVKKLKKQMPGSTFYGIGGDGMAGEGVTLVGHVRDMAVVGILEVFKSLGKISKAFFALLRLLDEKNPDLVVLIDYPDFNLLFARLVKKRNIPIIYFISPQVWAWRSGRVKLIKRLVKKMLVLFPFEEALYRKAGVDALCVGHPLVDEVKTSCGKDVMSKRLGTQGKQLVAILPGSRLSEVELLLPDMLEAAKLIKKSMPEVEFVLPLASTISPSTVEKYIQELDFPVLVAENSTYDVVSASDFAIVASGTATLEVAILGTPFVVCYRVNPVSYTVGKLLINVPYIGLVNIVAEKQVVPELIQKDLTPEAILACALPVLKSKGKAAFIRKSLSVVKEKLGEGGAAKKVSDEITSFLRYNNNV